MLERVQIGWRPPGRMKIAQHFSAGFPSAIRQVPAGTKDTLCRPTGLLRFVGQSPSHERLGYFRRRKPLTLSLRAPCVSLFAGFAIKTDACCHHVLKAGAGRLQWPE